MTIIWIIIFTLTPGELFLSYLFSLHDDTTARVFTINITDLRPEDEGRYWCGIKRPKPLPDLYTEVLLLVKTGDVYFSPMQNRALRLMLSSSSKLDTLVMIIVVSQHPHCTK
uniref:Immunoglobulin V-set domain-containing protein n=1 Tax=Pygocentrus nattereri TaxID=42514 RepID=A0A3B4DWA2_PYGNA